MCVDSFTAAEVHRHLRRLADEAVQRLLANACDVQAAALQRNENLLTLAQAHGGGNTGWSCAWIINMWARLYEGDKVYEHIKELLKTSTYNNLFDMCPPFQIDGNFGALAGITEALEQSYRGKIILLPALPSQWKKGSLTGIRVRGGGTVSIEWADGKLTKCVLETKPGREFKVVYGDTVINTVGSATITF